MLSTSWYVLRHYEGMTLYKTKAGERQQQVGEVGFMTPYCHTTEVLWPQLQYCARASRA